MHEAALAVSSGGLIIIISAFVKRKINGPLNTVSSIGLRIILQVLTISLAFKKVLGAVLQYAQYVILSTVMLEAAVLLIFAPLTYQKHLIK